MQRPPFSSPVAAGPARVKVSKSSRMKHTPWFNKKKLETAEKIIRKRTHRGALLHGVGGRPGGGVDRGGEGGVADVGAVLPHGAALELEHAADAEAGYKIKFSNYIVVVVKIFLNFN